MTSIFASIYFESYKQILKNYSAKTQKTVHSFPKHIQFAQTGRYTLISTTWMTLTVSPAIPSTNDDFFKNRFLSSFMKWEVVNCTLISSWISSMKKY